MFGMPDTTTRTPRFARRSNLLLVLAAISVTFMLFYPHIVSAQEEADELDDSDANAQSCPGATTVETFEGNTTQDTASFDIGSENWQVVVDTESSEDFSSTSVDVVESQSFSSVATKDFDNGTDGVIDVQGSGTYNLSIFTDLQSYEITVQECGGSGGQDSIDSSDTDNSSADQYQDEDDGVQTPPTGGPPLSVVAAILLWFGVGGILVARRFA
ncbi:hypothetical protein [Rubrobacter aplysinae]|uniref:hypothetical protein n=1 Tax=Rubrobacter aplysinae TaxID=909625 RepID=UPI00064C1E31|nr:hypothetical protein [Rubrobacter aplysinae]